MTESVTIAAGTSERAERYREALSSCEEELASGKVRFVVDAYPGDGPLAGLHAGLTALPGGYAFVMACDMPAVSGKLLARLAAIAIDGNGEADVVHVEGQPFHALYHTRVAGALAEALENRDYRVMRLLGRVRAIEVSADAGADAGEERESLADEEGLHNLNTPADYRNYICEFKKSGFQHRED
jgi:molybdopterin-guanine dinucleotide biosynthesis protein A